jgi:hypothetical protein
MKMLFALITVLFAMQSGIETIARESMSAVDSPRQAVARNEKEFAALWQAHAGPAKAAPKVDFTKRTVVAVFLGSRPTAGYGVDLTGTRQDGQALVIEWRESRPDRDSMVAQVLTSPAHLASIPKFDGEIRFEKAGK